MDLASFMFYILAIVACAGAFGVVMAQNPIFSALYLAVTMISVSGLFFNLGAHFVAGIQLIVYAGAVLVLFVMVVMLFDLKKENEGEQKPGISALLKALSVGAVMGLIVGGFEIARTAAGESPLSIKSGDSTRELSIMLFTKNLFAFEIISVLLLLVVVGALTLAKSKGGTHA